MYLPMQDTESRRGALMYIHLVLDLVSLSGSIYRPLRQGGNQVVDTA